MVEAENFESIHNHSAYALIECDKDAEDRIADRAEDVWNRRVLDLIDAGALVTINTDDPAMFDVSLAGEFSNLEQRLGLDDAALERLSLGSVEGSWADDETRADLKGRIEDWWAAG